MLFAHLKRYLKLARLAAPTRVIISRWRTQTTARFIAAYRQSIAGCPSLPQAKVDFEATLDAFVLEKALYEVC